MCAKHPIKVKGRANRRVVRKITACLLESCPHIQSLWLKFHCPAISDSSILSRHQTIPNQVLIYVKRSNNFKLLSSTHEMTPNQLSIPEHIKMAGVFLSIKSL